MKSPLKKITLLGMAAILGATIVLYWPPGRLKLSKATVDNQVLEADLTWLSMALTLYTEDHCEGVVPYITSRDLPQAMRQPIAGMDPVDVAALTRRHWIYQTAPNAVGKRLSGLDDTDAPFIEVYGGPDTQRIYAISWGRDMIAPRSGLHLGPIDESNICVDLRLLLASLKSYVATARKGVIPFVSSKSMPAEMRDALAPTALAKILKRNWTYQTSPGAVGKRLTDQPADKPLLEVFEGPQGLRIGGISATGEILFAPRG